MEAPFVFPVYSMLSTDTKCHSVAFRASAAELHSCISLIHGFRHSHRRLGLMLITWDITCCLAEHPPCPPYMRYAAATWRSFSFGEAINTEDLPLWIILLCKLFRVYSRFAVIGCLEIRLVRVSFHARDDNNGRRCRDDCWHHYSCALPHTSIFTCYTDAPEVNEFFTLEFRVGSHEHMASHMRAAQQVKQRLASLFFFYLSFIPLYQIVQFFLCSRLISLYSIQMQLLSCSATW